MSVTIERISQGARVDVRITVEAAADGSDDMRPDYSSVQSKRFRPSLLKVEYYCSPGEPWKTTDIEVTGPILKRDGTLSESARGRRRVATFSSQGGLDAAPQWVRDMVESATPVPFTWAD